MLLQREGGKRSHGTLGRVWEGDLEAASKQRLCKQVGVIQVKEMGDAARDRIPEWAKAWNEEPN